MDDIIIATEADNVLHEKHIRHFLKKLKDNDLFLKPEKCCFHQREVDYLGVIIGQGSVQMDPIKIQGIVDWPKPKTVRDIRSFLGFCNFYRAFIPNFSTIARPLNDLTKKNQQWQWGSDEQSVFQSLKDACTSNLVLRTPDWTKQFILETDASGYALGAVIMQQFDNNVHPIAFHSRSLLPAEKNYDTHDKELAGVVFQGPVTLTSN
jgi:hypothetical protein